MTIRNILGSRTRIHVKESDFAGLQPGDSIRLHVTPTSHDADYNNEFWIVLSYSWWFGKSYVKTKSWTEDGENSFPKITEELSHFIEY